METVCAGRAGDALSPKNRRLFRMMASESITLGSGVGGVRWVREKRKKTEGRKRVKD